MGVRGLKVDVVMMDALRRSNAVEDVHRLKTLQQRHAGKERQETQAQEALQRAAPLPLVQTVER